MAGNQDNFGELWNIKFTVSLTAGLISLIFAVGFILAFVFGKVDRDLLRFVVSTTATAAAITSAFYVGENIRRTFTSKKTDRSLQYISVWTSSSFASVRKSVRQVRDAIQEEPDQNRHAEVIKLLLNKNHDLEEDIITIMNFLEEISLSIQTGLVDEVILEDYFKVIVRRFCSVFSLWIAEQRRQRGNELYRCLTRLNEKWNPN